MNRRHFLKTTLVSLGSGAAFMTLPGFFVPIRRPLRPVYMTNQEGACCEDDCEELGRLWGDGFHDDARLLNEILRKAESQRFSFDLQLPGGRFLLEEPVKRSLLHRYTVRGDKGW